ncbi:hypothetical protein CHH28_11075 [Bacterioplanes sanyensis]|uniref:Uncharacterized protein n=1 Tax=Bacterioplanes sanyensis TaxID=1249553 RepID=A0A222FKS0_9GAMM|nr:hypothetical protein [Bacterioplanes sanyensis]ASP39186.1 hypothetical protein CHH28_11075 [Bacterioplanes sanyensis]
MTRSTPFWHWDYTGSMTILLSLIIVSVIIGLLSLVMLADRGRRNSLLRQAADQLGLKFRPYASLSQPVRQAQFHLIECGQFRHFRYLLEGEFQQRPVNIFDYSLVNQQGASTQTVVLLHCPLDGKANWRLQCWQKHWLRGDALTDQQPLTLTPLSPHQKPAGLRKWHIASSEVGLVQPYLAILEQWCLAHPHLHIEYAAGMLMLYRPQYELAAEHLEQALQAGCELCQRLATPQAA